MTYNSWGRLWGQLFGATGEQESSDVNVAPGQIIVTTAFGTPTIPAAITTTAISCSCSLGTPTTTGECNAGGFICTTVFGQPSIDSEVPTSNLSGSATIGTPAVNFDIIDMGLSGSTTIGTPTVRADSTIAPNPIPGITTLGEINIKHKFTPPISGNRRAIYSLTDDGVSKKGALLPSALAKPVVPDVAQYQGRFYDGPEYAKNLYRLDDDTITDRQPLHLAGVVSIYLGGHENEIEPDDVALLIEAGYSVSVGGST